MRLRKYSQKQAENGVKVRLSNILSLPPPEYKTERCNGFNIMYLNGIWTVINLKPLGTIEQWEATVNGILLDKDPVSMTKVYREIARLNPPARHFY